MSPEISSETASALAARIHLDAVGGIAGDMFAAAMVDTFPQLEAGVLAAVASLPTPAGATVGFVAHRDAVLGGRRFVVRDPTAAAVAHDHAGGHHHHHHRARAHDHGDGHGHDDHHGDAHTADAHDHAHSHSPEHPHDHAHAHGHVHHDYASIRVMLDRAPLTSSVRAHALGLFRVLAEAEASVHGMEVDRVSFHEVGAWDSIVDFVAAAYLIDAAGSARFTWSALPMGGGRIQSAHGVLPVPAPATTLLLRGMAMVDDGVSGERVTPTGAAILRYLRDNGHGSADGTPVAAANTGFGFGTRTMKGMSNVLRCIAFDPVAGGSAERAQDERVTMLNFEIDDQSGEDLAVALDRLRAVPGVLDVMQSAAMGKKGRLVAAVQLQVRPSAVNAVADLVFLETTTLGLRVSDVTRRVLARAEIGTLADGSARAKVAQRPGNVLTAKAEIDDVAAIAGHAERERARAATASHALRAHRH